MPLIDSQSRWRGITTTVVVELLILLALAFATVRYVEWSSDTAVAEFMSASKPMPSDRNHSGESSSPIQLRKGRTSCELKGLSYFTTDH
jgi:hypothetical protein